MRRGIIAAANGGWSPARLYAGDGDYYLSDDLSRLFQDAAKTTPATANGDVLGAVVGQLGYGPDLTQATGANKPLLSIDGGETSIYLIDQTATSLVGNYARSYANPIWFWCIQRAYGAGSTVGVSVGFKASGNQSVLIIQPSRNTNGQVSFRNSLDTFITAFDAAQHRLTAASMSVTAGAQYLRWQGPTSEIDATPGAYTGNIATIRLESFLANLGARVVAFGFRELLPTQDEMNLLSAWGVRRYGAQF